MAGFVELQDNGHLDLLYVHPEFERRGVASSLLSACTAWGTQHEIAFLFTEASLTARPFFDHHGFRLITPQTVVRNGETFINFRMEKRL